MSVTRGGGISLAANVLNQDEKVRYGAQNWGFVSCARPDIRLGEYHDAVLILLQLAVVIDLYLQILWRYGARITCSRRCIWILHPE